MNSTLLWCRLFLNFTRFVIFENLLVLDTHCQVGRVIPHSLALMTGLHTATVTIAPSSQNVGRDNTDTLSDSTLKYIEQTTAAFG